MDYAASTNTQNKKNFSLSWKRREMAVVLVRSGDDGCSRMLLHVFDESPGSPALSPSNKFDLFHNLEAT